MTVRVPSDLGILDTFGVRGELERRDAVRAVYGAVRWGAGGRWVKKSGGERKGVGVLRGEGRGRW